MAKIIRRLIRLFIRLGIIKKYINIVYDGELFSLNQLYSSGHFRTRATLKKKYKKIYTELLEDYSFEMANRFSLIIFYNSRHDPDNITGMAKMFVDVLQEEGRIINDTKNFYKLYAVVPDLELPKNTLHFYLIDHDNKR